MEAITLKGLASFIRSLASYTTSPPNKSTKEENAPLSGTSKGISSYKDGSNRCTSRDGGGTVLSKRDLVKIPAFPFPLA